ncbi:glycosyltransferase [Anderseniella sp. Alg231-50]|uniref:glycosyltransferase n=1 Tax=Anderseniella sp. Alg231-50 TaxID=1922226 RepID=UPI000D54D160
MRPLKTTLKSLTGDGEPGVSLVTCCRNRSDNLKTALSSWLKHEDISEIVIVDWSSDVPLRRDLEDFIDVDERIRVVRVEEEKSWILTYAYNTGFRCASHECILKADADIVLNPDFFQTNKLRKGEFLAGNWRIVPEDQAHINGFFLTRKSDLADAGGFNEFITAYGWDDDDLYDRLTANGLKRRDIDPDTIHHLPHDDEARSQVFKSDEADKVATVGELIRKSPQFGIRRNYYIAALMPAWSRHHQMASFSVVDQQDGHQTMKRLDAGGNEVPQTVKDEADYFALKDMVNWNHGLSASTDRTTFFSLMSGSFSDLEAFVETLSKQSVKAWLYHKFQWRWLQPTVANARLGKPSISVPRPKLYIDAQHGLGNRLRAIASGAAIAEATERELVIVWESDSHCECQFGDLYDYEGAVMGRSFADEAAARGVNFVTYMELEANARKHKPIRLREGADFYARTAYVLNSPYTSDEAENVFLQRLQPVEAVLDLVSSVRSPNDVAAHVRMTGGAGFEHLAYETSDNWNKRSHKKIGHWRQKSHFSNFMKRIDRLASEKQAERIFLAADQLETYVEFQERYGGRVAFLPRELYDRSSEQLMYALADALLLGRAPLLLGSTWSSFSELAIRLSAQNIEVEMSGKDF